MSKAPERIFIDQSSDYELVLEAWPKILHTPNNNEIEYILKETADKREEELIDLLKEMYLDKSVVIPEHFLTKMTELKVIAD